LLTLETVDGVRWSRCADCGRDTRRIHGFVYEDGVPFAVYHADLPEGHEHDRALFLVSIGDWGVEADSAARERATIWVQRRPDELQMSFDDPDPDAVITPELGRMISRAEALGSPLRSRYLEVCNLIAAKDARVKAALGWFA
jgi:hypothetical protein